MEEKDLKQEELVEKEQETPQKPPHVLDSDFAQRALKAYNTVQAEDELFDMTTAVLSIGHAYMTALDMSKELNHKQGKARLSSNFISRDLMKFAAEDPEETINSRVGELLIAMINRYIDSHFIMQNSTQDYVTKTEQSMKVLYITLISGGYMDIIRKLHTPKYIAPMVKNALSYLREQVNSIMVEWRTYLQENENEDMIQLSETVGLDLFTGSKAIDTFKKYFREFIPNLKNYDQTYDKYMELRKRYNVNVVNIAIKDLYQFFDVSHKQFLAVRRDWFLPEFQSMFLNTEYEEPLKLLILGN